MKTNLWIPHIDKTGGIMLINTLEKFLPEAGWTFERDARTNINKEQMISKKHARIGMHNPYLPDYMDDTWFKFLVLREPYSRFVSTFNYFKFDLYLTQGSFVNMTLEEYIDLVIQKNMGMQKLAIYHLGSNHRSITYKNYIENVLYKFPWNLFFDLRGYIDSLTALNAEKINDCAEYTIENIFECFDVIIDTTRFDELQNIFFKNLGLDVYVDKEQNTSEKNYGKIIGNQSPFLLKDLTDEQRNKINEIEAFQIEQQLWEAYKRSKHNAN